MTTFYSDGVLMQPTDEDRFNDAMLKATSEANGWHEKNSANLQSSQPKPRVCIDSLTSAEFAAREYRYQYHVEGCVSYREPGVIGGASKTLKTGISIDLALSLGFGSPFLGRFQTTQTTVGIISGESGERTLQETSKRQALAKGRLLSSADVHWSFRCPCLLDPTWRVALTTWVKERNIQFLVIDPAYLALLTPDVAKGASNLLVMGAALRGFSEVIAETDVSVWLNHHVSKGQARLNSVGNDPPDLQDLSMSGFSEFARQWMMVGRREKYEIGTGEHRLWLNVGGSAGHGGLYALDIDEGRLDDEGGRRWDVTVRDAAEARTSEASEREAEKREQACDKVLDYLRRYPDGQTLRALRDDVGNSQPIKDAVNYLKGIGEVIESEIIKNKRPERALKLV